MPPFVPGKRLRSKSPASSPPSSIKPKTASSKAPKTNKKTDLFDQADSTQRSARTLEENMAFLQEQADEDDDDDSSRISDLDSDDFEDAMPAPPPKRRKVADEAKEKSHESDQDEDEDEMEWEDATNHREPTISGDLHLTLDEIPQHSIGSFTNPHAQKKGPSKIERSIRVNTHCMHVQCLLFHNLVRNGYICDKKVQKILVDSLPPGVSREVERYKKASGIGLHAEEKAEKESTPSKSSGKEKKLSKQHKNQRDWGNRADHAEGDPPALSASDPTVRLLKVLCSFWRKKFNIDAPGLRKQGYKDLARLEKELKSLRSDEHDFEEHGERIESVEQFRELAKSCSGSRDVGAQLFTALLRGIGLEVRMVNNLQPVGFGWSKNEEALPKKNKPKSAKQAPSKTESVKNPQKIEPPLKPRSKTSQKGPQSRKMRLGGDKNQPIDLSDDDSGLSSPPDSDDDDAILDITPADLLVSTKKYDRDLPFPVYWTEVLSPIAQTWIPVDPVVLSIVATNPEYLLLFEPRGARADKAKQVLAYVVAFSADGTAKDVTVRYMKRHMWPGKTKGVRIPVEKVPVYNRRGKVKRYEEYDWFKTVMSCFARSSEQRTPADDIEEARDLQAVKINRDGVKAGEETLQGYKNSAEFVLERHLRREEALLPGAKQVRTFTTGKGDKAKTEPVYLRKDVVTCRTTESWHKQGREVKEGEQPLKLVPMRAVTTIRKREIEEVERETGEKQKQGLYSWDQTDWIIPEPIKDGVIPKNVFGNMDVYVPTMVPAGGVHIPLRGTAKVCKRLEIDYAEACTGFEFGNRMAVPILTGVVVAKEHEDLVIDAWEVEMAEKRKKEEAKREKLALGMWKKMLAGLKVLERVRKEYGDDADNQVQTVLRHKAGKNSKKLAAKERDKPIVLTDEDEEKHHGGLAQEDFARAAEGGGGFMTANDIGDDDNDGGGFLTKDTEHDLPGGFVLDNGDGAALQRGSSYPRTPMSLEPAQRREIYHDNDKQGQTPLNDPDDSDSSIPIKPTPTKQSSRQTPRSVAADKMSSTRKASKKKAVITPPESPEDDDDAGSDEEEEKYRRRSAGKRKQAQPTRAVGKRNAARKSADATRSHYFTVDTDDDDE